MGQIDFGVEAIGSVTVKYLLAFMTLSALSGTAYAAIELRPHRAYYELKAGDIDKKSGIISADGLLAYEITGNACEGWTTTYRIALRYMRSEQGEQLNDTQVRSWEAGDGSQLQLEEKQYSDNRLSVQKNIKASRAKGAEGEVHQTRPVDKLFSIPSDALFPMAHQVQLLEAAAAGLERKNSVVFDGSDDDKPTYAVTVFGKPRASASLFPGLKPDVAAELRSSPGYTMSVSYYGLDPKASDAPDYQTTFTMYGNGVSTDLLFDYGGYTLAGKLTDLKFLPVSACPKE